MQADRCGDVPTAPVALDYTALYQTVENSPLASWARDLPPRVAAALSHQAHGDLPAWLALLAGLPPIQPASIDLRADTVRIGDPGDCDAVTKAALEASLRALHPWRKGPFSLFGIHIDSEWRSDWKWARLRPHITPLAGRRVLDVGCGNGYYALRMAGEGASLVVGIDPTLRYVIQFAALRHYLGPLPVHVLPLGIEALPREAAGFDTVFSMGVFYHRRSPLDHLLELRACLRPGGELVLETLVIEGDEGAVLVPRGRYAQMRNVWFIPSGATLAAWLQRCGYGAVRLVDVTPTTTAEQRATDWMRFQSLADFLDPRDPGRTVEGYPAPRRAIFVAQA